MSSLLQHELIRRLAILSGIALLLCAIAFALIRAW